MEFKFNENGVCVNPEYIKNFNKKGDIGYTLKIACKDAKWCAGYEIRLRGAVSAVPTTFRHGCFSSRHDAIMRTLRYLLDYSEQGSGDEDNEDPASMIPMIKRHISAVAKECTPRQIEIDFGEKIK